MDAVFISNEVILLVIIFASFSSALVLLFILLSILRRQRIAAQQPKLIPVIHPTVKSAPVAPAQAATIVKPSPRPVRPAPSLISMPVRPGTPEQVIIMIEPDKGPTRQEHNVQRIIEYLKRMDNSTKAEAG